MLIAIAPFFGQTYISDAKIIRNESNPICTSPRLGRPYMKYDNGCGMSKPRSVWQILLCNHVTTGKRLDEKLKQ